MRRRNATAAGSSARASSRNRCNSDMLTILPAVAGKYVPVCCLPCLQRPDHPPALDVRPLAIGSDDDRTVEHEFARLDLAGAFLGDALQGALVRRPACLPTGLVHPVEEADVRRR